MATRHTVRLPDTGGARVAAPPHRTLRTTPWRFGSVTAATAILFATLLAGCSRSEPPVYDALRIQLTRDLFLHQHTGDSRAALAALQRFASLAPNQEYIAQALRHETLRLGVWESGLLVAEGSLETAVARLDVLAAEVGEAPEIREARARIAALEEFRHAATRLTFHDSDVTGTVLAGLTQHHGHLQQSATYRTWYQDSMSQLQALLRSEKRRAARALALQADRLTVQDPDRAGIFRTLAAGAWSEATPHAETALSDLRWIAGFPDARPAATLLPELRALRAAGSVLRRHRTPEPLALQAVSWSTCLLSATVHLDRGDWGPAIDFFRELGTLGQLDAKTAAWAVGDHWGGATANQIFGTDTRPCPNAPEALEAVLAWQQLIRNKDK